MQRCIPEGADSVTLLELWSGVERWLDMAGILIVDTQTGLHHQLVRLLERAGYQTTAVATISEATRLLTQHAPDLLVTNVVLTDGSGVNLAKQAEAAGVKVLMITGSPDRMVEFDGSGQPYLSKPFVSETFLRRVQEILSTDNKTRDVETSFGSTGR